MTDSSSLLPTTVAIATALLCALTSVFLTGWLLVPAKYGSSKLLTIALRMASGLLFLSGVSALFILGRPSYAVMIPVVQVAVMIAKRMRRRNSTSLISHSDEKWSAKEIVDAAVICGVGALLFHLPYQRISPDGTIRIGHGDLGYFAESVIGLAEAKTANLWAATLGSAASAVSDGRDFWYHWGPIQVAALVRAASGLSAIVSLMDVVGSVMNVILILVAASLSQALMKGSTRKHLLLGAFAVTASTILKVPEVMAWLVAHLPFGDIEHTRTHLAVYFAYKFEAIAVLAAIAAWLHGRDVFALVLLFCGAVSAPHTVAALGVTGAGLAGLGICLRKPAIMKTGFCVVGIVALAWAVVVLAFSAQMGGGGPSLAMQSISDVLGVVQRGTVDAIVALMLSAPLIPGMLRLIRRAPEDRSERLQTLGIALPAGMIVASFAYHWMHQVGDAFHVMLFVNSVIVMPLGALGLFKLVTETDNRAKRSCSAILAIGTVTMGLHTLMLPRMNNTIVEWTTNDLNRIKQALEGRPFGYYSTQDRGWWLPKYGFVAAMLDSRCIRLNPRPAESESKTSTFYDYTKPFKLVPPQPNEPSHLWSLRFAERLGIRHILETPDDRLPAKVTQHAHLVVDTAGLRLYELTGSADSVAAK